MNKKSTEYANAGSKFCKPPAYPGVFNDSKEIMAPSAGVPITPQPIGITTFLKIVCMSNISMNTHECPRICKPRGIYHGNIQDCI
jgi:hypothetical protein